MCYSNVRKIRGKINKEIRLFTNALENLYDSQIRVTLKLEDLGTNSLKIRANANFPKLCGKSLNK